MRVQSSEFKVQSSPIPIPTRRQALEQVRRCPGFKGICRMCGCTERNACTDQGMMGDETCGWANKEQTLCTNYDCLRKASLEAV
jgi:hypothetical protein